MRFDRTMGRMVPFWLILLISFAALAPCGVAAGPISRGRAIAGENCARCHAIGRHGESPNPKAPPFRLLHRRFPLEQIEEALAEGIMVGHNGPEMPQFVLAPGQINDLIAYLHTISSID
jgi:cytochrome c